MGEEKSGRGVSKKKRQKDWAFDNRFADDDAPRLGGCYVQQENRFGVDVLTFSTFLVLVLGIWYLVSVHVQVAGSRLPTLEPFGAPAPSELSCQLGSSCPPPPWVLPVTV